MKKKIILKVIISTLFIVSILPAYYYGKNKVRTDKFQWYILPTEHFNVYFYYNDEVDKIKTSKLAKKVARISEEAYIYLSKKLRHEFKEKKPIIFYKSHNDFKQTNIILQIITEGVGGFSEIFRHRLVIPYLSSEKKLRELLTHELTHIFQYDLWYPDAFTGALRGDIFRQPPIWFIEGMADYLGCDNDITSKMVLRDAVISNSLLPLQMLNDMQSIPSNYWYLMYKEGQAAIEYIEEKYGEARLARMYHYLKKTKDMDVVMNRVLGIGLEDFNKKWTSWLQHKIWTNIEEKKTPDFYGNKIERAYKQDDEPRLFFSWSPSGELIAYLTTKNGYIDIEIISNKGEYIKNITKDNWSKEWTFFKNNDKPLSWSPDGNYIAFIAQYQVKDYIFVIDILTNDVVERYNFGMDAISSPTWSPDGTRLAFVGVQYGRSDVYIYNFNTKQIQNITDGYSDVRSPFWSSDNNKLLFCREDRNNYNIYEYNFTTNSEKVVIRNFGDCYFPTYFQNDNQIIFNSDYINGLSNIFIYDKVTGKTIQLTNVSSGIIRPVWNNKKNMLGFSGYINGKMEIFQKYLPNIDFQDTQLLKIVSYDIDPHAKESNQDIYDNINFVLSEAVKDDDIKEKVFTKKINKYKLKFLPDYISTYVEYDFSRNLRSYTTFSMSDILGNHRFHLATDLIQITNETKITDFNLNLQYANLSYPVNMIFGIYNEPYRFQFENLLGNYAERGLYGFFSYPIDTFRRVEGGVTSRYREYPDYLNTTSSQSNVINLNYIKDTVIYKSMISYNGVASGLFLEQAAPIFKNDDLYSNIRYDYRLYKELLSELVLATRVNIMASFGPDRNDYLIGGYGTVKGYRYGLLDGSKAALLNAELRFPFIREIRFGLPIVISNIRGAIFFDWGYAWNDDFHPFTISDKKLKLDRSIASIGYGFRIGMGIFDFRFDYVFKTDFDYLSNRIFFFSIGWDY